MKRVFVCSPFSGDTSLNVTRALQYCREVVLQGHAPYAPHTYLTKALDDNRPEERILGMLAGTTFLDTCEELWAFFDETPSAGMLLEMDYARENGIKIRRYGIGGVGFGERVGGSQ